MNGIILRAGWREALARLDAANVAVLVAAGARDRVPVPAPGAELAAEFRHVRAVAQPGAGDDLPVSRPGWCAALLDARQV